MVKANPARDHRSRVGFFYFPPGDLGPAANGACAQNKAVVTSIIRRIPRNLLFNL
jgi:hypothetical protein